MNAQPKASGDQPREDPLATLAAWYAEAASHPSIRYPHCACLATAGEVWPDARMVLVHRFGPRGLLFGTDRRSAKARQLARAPRACLVFHWQPLERQVRVRGCVEPGEATEADLTFDDRPRESRITAWASCQSQQAADRATLEAAWQQAARRFASIEAIPRPDTWRAYWLIPEEIELWQAGRHRLHTRTRYRRSDDGCWQARVLAP